VSFAQIINQSLAELLMEESEWEALWFPQIVEELNRRGTFFFSAQEE